MQETPPHGTGSSDLVVCAVWQLPDDFFQLNLDAQWEAIKKVTKKAKKLSEPRKPCKMGFIDEALVVVFFLICLGLVWVLGILTIVLFLTGSAKCKWSVALFALCALHPLPRFSLLFRSSRLSLAIIRYFSYEILWDRNNPFLDKALTSAVDEREHAEKYLPVVTLACPHGVFNWGAIAWCCISRWVCGWYQVTGGADALHYVPGMRYLDLLIWMVGAQRKSIKRVLQEYKIADASGALTRQGGMLGMVPDGITGAFRGKPGVDELIIGKKRGLMRICLEEGAHVYAGWFFGTTDMMKIMKDPFGILEMISRKAQAGILGYYGRWYLPVPRRIAVTQIMSAVKAPKITAPTEEQVEKLHQEVYGGLEKLYMQQRDYAGYPDRTLVVK